VTTPVLFVLLLVSIVVGYTTHKASAAHITDLQERNGWLYDQNRQQAERIKELERQCQ
jgi:hypothetical protein